MRQRDGKNLSKEKKKKRKKKDKKREKKGLKIESESDRKKKKGERDERSSPWFVSGLQELPELVCSRLKRSTSAPEAETGKQDQRVARATCMTHIVLKPHG